MKTPAKPSGFEKVGECLYRRTSSGTYYARFKWQGKEIHRSLDTDDRALAKRRLLDLQRSTAQTVRGGGRITVAEMCDRFLAANRNRAPATIVRNEAIARRIKNEWPGGSATPISKVVPSTISAWLASYSFGIPSFNLHLSFIRAAFELAVADHLIATSPAAGLKMAKPKRPVRKTPSFEEFQAIVASIRAQVFSNDAQDSGNFVEFLGLAGLGQAEVQALRWSDINWQKGQITTFRQKTSHGFVIPLYPQLRPLLEKMRQAHEANPASPETVFRVQDAKKALAAACRRLNLPAYSPRSFRRMFITRALERGIDVKTVALWQGHRDGGKLILDTYSHVNATHSERMAKLME